MKRKLLPIILSIVIVLVLSSCGEPYETYDKILGKYNKEDFLTTKFENKLTIKGADVEVITTSSGTMQRYYDENYTVCVKGNLSSSASENVTIDFEKWFAGDNYFLSMSGGKVYSNMTYEEVLNDLGLYGLINGVKGEDFDAIIENPADSGNKKLDFILKKHASEVCGLSKMIQKISERFNGECSISAISGNIIFDGSIPVSQKYSVNAELVAGEQTYQVSYDVTTQFDFDTEFKLDPPSTDGYTKVNN